jgi:transcriptional regulator of NAD metabolism
MEKIIIQRIILRKLWKFHPPKWNESHTEEKNVFKCFPKHMRGTKEVKKALEELYQLEFINRYKKTGETHISLNIRKKKEIEEFMM